MLNLKRPGTLTSHPKAAYLALNTRQSNEKFFVLLFANLGGNIGDLCIIENTIDGLRSRFTDCALTIALLPNRQRKDLIEILLKKYENIRIVSAFNKDTSLKYFFAPEKWTPYLVKVWFQLVILRARSSALADSFARADGVFGVGGGHWKGFRTSLNMLALLKVASERCDNVVLLPQSLPRSVPGGIQLVMPDALRNITSIYFRDPESLRQAKRIGLRDAVLLPDTVFLAGSKPVRTVPDKSNPAIAINLRSDTPGLKPDRWDRLTSVLRVMKEKGCVIKAFTTYAQKDKAVLQMFSMSKDVEIVNVNTVEDTLATISSSDVVISDRLHVLIFATIVGTPMIPVSYISKIQGYVEQLDYPITVSGFTELSWDRHIAPILRDWESYHRLLLDFSAAARQELTSSLFL
jgi:polysaccharide pyruvyl transferase WcaK-like protein